jgi:hypothetical protein
MVDMRFFLKLLAGAWFIIMGFMLHFSSAELTNEVQLTNRAAGWPVGSAIIWAIILVPTMVLSILSEIGKKKLAASPNRENAEEGQLSGGDLRKCPFCAELIKNEAIVCKHCGRDLPKEQPATKPTELQPDYSRSEAPTPSGARKRLMQHFGITYDGKNYIRWQQRQICLRDVSL